MPTRRRFLTLSSAAVIPGVVRGRAADPAAVPVTGVADKRLAPFDDLLTGFLADHKLPGAAVAVARRGKLVYARGFGHADAARTRPVEPAALFRIASVSKPLTAVAVLQLAGAKKLALDAPVLDYVKLTPHLEPGAKPDPRWHRVTVRQCLHHTGGWDRDKSYDPIGIPWKIAKALGSEPPVAPAQVVRYMLGQPLDFDPGARFAYSNLGYLVLGRVIEAASGVGYAEYVRNRVLAPLGVTATQLGRALPEHRAKTEVAYHDSKARTGRCLYPPRRGRPVPLPDGAENFEGFEAHGGWVASAVDLARFAAAFDDPKRCPILGEKLVAEMRERPPGAAGFKANGKPKDVYYGCGWQVRPVNPSGAANLWHSGLIGGTSTLLVRRWDGLNWAVLFNTDADGGGKQPADLIDGPMHAAADKVRAWPDRDLFSEFLR